jgi:hypothetical protein
MEGKGTNMEDGGGTIRIIINNMATMSCSRVNWENEIGTGTGMTRTDGGGNYDS